MSGVSPPDGLPWWRVHLGTFVGSVVMAVATVVIGLDAFESGTWTSWVTTLGLGVNAGGLLAVSRERALSREYEGPTPKMAKVSQLGPHGRREWWWTLVAFAGFALAVATTILG